MSFYRLSMISLHEIKIEDTFLFPLKINRYKNNLIYYYLLQYDQNQSFISFIKGQYFYIDNTSKWSIFLEKRKIEVALDLDNLSALLNEFLIN